MKHLSSIVLAAAVVAAGAVACFKDPTSSARNGASRIELTRSTAFLNVGDSLSVQAEIKDDQGNSFDATDAEWTTSDALVAVVNVDSSKTIPYNAFSRAFIRSTGGGKAVVHFASHGLSDSIVVYSLPPTFTGAVTFPAGLMMADTITIAATSALTFTDSTTVTIGGVAAVILSHTATVLKVVAGAPAAAGSKVVFTHLLLSGAVDMSLTATTTVTVASTVRGGSVSVGAATYNVGDTVTLTANGSVRFSVAAGNLSAVTVGGAPTWILSQSATQIKLISPSAAAGTAITITNVILLGSVPLPSLNAATTVTVTEANEPGNDSPATPSALTLYTDYYGTVSSSDVDDYLRFTTTTADSVRIELQWITDADNDLYLLNAAGGGFCALDGCLAAGSSNPEHLNIRLAAATTYQFDVNNFAVGSVEPILYRLRTIKLQ